MHFDQIFIKINKKKTCKKGYLEYRKTLNLSGKQKYKTNIFRAKIDGAILAVIKEVRVQTLPPAGVTFFHDRNETLIPTFFPF